MLDTKLIRQALEQLEEERKIPQAKLLEAIEQALAAAYKKEYGKRGQIVRAHFDLDTGETSFVQVKKVVDDTMVYVAPDGEEEAEVRPEGDERVRFNEEHHIMWDDAKKIKKDIGLDEEIIFPLEHKEDFGRIAAQTAKQVIIQRIRDAERSSIIDEYGAREGEIISGTISKIDRGTVYVDFNRATGMLGYEEQITGEQYRRGDRIRAYLFSVEETPRGVAIRLSRTHPKFIEKLFEMEVPELAAGTVEIKAIAREPGSRSKVAVTSHDTHVDPTGAFVGQRGTRVTTVTNELSGEKIDIIEWSEDPAIFVAKSLSPAKVLDIVIDLDEHKASVEVAEDQLSLAIGKGGQNVRLAAKLTGWRIDIKGVAGIPLDGEAPEGEITEDGEGYINLRDLKSEEKNEEVSGEEKLTEETKNE